MIYKDLYFAGFRRRSGGRNPDCSLRDSAVGPTVDSYYPGIRQTVQRPNIVNTPLAAGTGSHGFRSAVERDWLPAIEAHRPDLILVSAGFDAHRADPLAGLELDDDDYRWITQFIVDAANRYADGRVVSTLEGGYDLDALARSASLHVQGLL